MSDRQQQGVADAIVKGFKARDSVGAFAAIEGAKCIVLDGWFNPFDIAQDAIAASDARFVPGLVEALRLILPMAKGYAHAHSVGSNGWFVEIAEERLAQLPEDLQNE